MKRIVTFMILGACHGMLLDPTPARAATSEAESQPICAWRRYAELHRMSDGRRYGFKVMGPEQTQALQLVCTIARLAIASRQLPYLFRIDCHRYDDGTWICLATLLPTNNRPASNVFLIPRTTPATRYPGSFRKNIEGLLSYIRDWSS